MSNFKCSECGMTNIDCGKAGYKTPREIELENKLKEIQNLISNKEDECDICENYKNGYCTGTTECEYRKDKKILAIINENGLKN